MTRKGLIFTLAIAGVLLVLIFRAAQQRPSSSPADVSSQTLDGQTWQLRDQRGKVVLLDFWATWCPYCIKAMPEMKQIHDRFKRHTDFVMVSVSQDDSAAEVQKFLDTQPLPWMQLLDPHSRGLATAFGVTALPTVVLLDRDGTVAGVDLSNEELAKKIDALLSK